MSRTRTYSRMPPQRTEIWSAFIRIAARTPPLGGEETPPPPSEIVSLARTAHLNRIAVSVVTAIPGLLRAQDADAATLCHRLARRRPVAARRVGRGRPACQRVRRRGLEVGAAGGGRDRLPVGDA